MSRSQTPGRPPGELGEAKIPAGRAPHPATVGPRPVAQPRMVQPALPPHPATVHRDRVAQPAMARPALPPHPALGRLPFAVQRAARAWWEVEQDRLIAEVGVTYTQTQFENSEAYTLAKEALEAAAKLAARPKAPTAEYRAVLTSAGTTCIVELVVDGVGTEIGGATVAKRGSKGPNHAEMQWMNEHGEALATAINKAQEKKLESLRVDFHITHEPCGGYCRAELPKKVLAAGLTVEMWVWAYKDEEHGNGKTFYSLSSTSCSYAGTWT